MKARAPVGLSALAAASCLVSAPAELAPSPAIAPPAAPAPRATVAAPASPIGAAGPPPLTHADDRAPLARSSTLASGLSNPMPGGVFAGYQADTGLDIAGSPRPVFALAPGTLDYSEPGHTLWTSPSDTANCVRFELDQPIAWRGRRITHVYYAHLSKLDVLQPEHAPVRRHVEAGERLGFSGRARGSPHLHIGLLLDGEVEQYRGTFLLADQILEVLGGYRNGQRLPAE